MFNQYLKTFENIIEEAKNSKQIIQKEYFPIYEEIESYVKKNNLILSNIETLINKEKSSFRNYIIYGENIFRHANNISNNIAKNTIYVTMYTNKKNEDFSVSINGSQLIRFFNIKKQLITNSIMPVNINGLLMYPPEFELIEIYHKLYLPNYAEEWGSLKKTGDILYKQMHERRKKFGGYHNKKENNKIQKLKGGFINNKLIIKWLASRCDYVLIGINAINILIESSSYHQKIQIITDTSIDKLISEFSSLIFQYIGFRITHKIHNSNIPTEPRLRKVIISVRLPDKISGNFKTIHLLDIFDSAKYELVPYITIDGINIGYPNVLRTFILIDMWTIRILLSFNIIKKDTVRQYVDIVFENFENINNIKISKYSTESYLGTYSNIDRYNQKESLKNTFFPYIPEQHRYQKGEYRKIQ
jgi:hypothetical protein